MGAVVVASVGGAVITAEVYAPVVSPVVVCVALSLLVLLSLSKLLLLLLGLWLLPLPLQLLLFLRFVVLAFLCVVFAPVP
jgi:hypothetical protein